MHAFVNDLVRKVGAYLYGRRMYEVMRYWETHALADRPSVEQDFAQIWRAADKVVYSRTLETVSSARTRIERDFDPEAVRRMKTQAERDIGVGGPDLAAQAFKAGLVDECHLFVTPVVVGGGKRSLPRNVRLELELLDERRFEGGVVHLHYSTMRKETATPDGPIQDPKRILGPGRWILRVSSNLHSGHSGKLWLARAPGLPTWHHTFSGVTISKEETNR